ncbi:MAG: hypothetical protein U0531_05210 [Dehalococcoidia bacterium]
MAARTGAQYLDGLRDEREVWLNGARVHDVTTHPPCARGPPPSRRFVDLQGRAAPFRSAETVAGASGRRAGRAPTFSRRRRRWG